MSPALRAALDAYEQAATRWGAPGGGYLAVVKARAEVVRLIEAEIAAARGQKP